MKEQVASVHARGSRIHTLWDIYTFAVRDALDHLVRAHGTNTVVDRSGTCCGSGGPYDTIITVAEMTFYSIVAFCELS